MTVYDEFRSRSSLTGDRRQARHFYLAKQFCFLDADTLDLGQSVIHTHFSKIFSIIAWPIKVKFHVEHSWEGETKV